MVVVRYRYRNRSLPLSSTKRANSLSVLMWWFDARDTPVLIPNTEVKPRSGDGSVGTTMRE